MLESEKLYVIDLGEDVNPTPPVEPPRDIIRKPARPVVARPRPVKKPVTEPWRPPAVRLHFATSLVLSYLLGPFGLLLWPDGRGNPAWSILSVFSGVGSVVLAWQWRNILGLGSSGSLLFPLLMLTAVVSLCAFTAWAKGLHLAYASRARSHTTWPAWMRSAWAVTGLGLVAPGLGLYLTGSPRRAVAALWAFWPVFFSAIVLAHAGWTWQWMQSTLHTADLTNMFENLLLMVAGAAALGVVWWVVQALAGLHRQSRQAQISGSPHGDRYAVALLAAVLALAVWARPATLATVANDAGIVLQEKGLRTIPLYLAQSAHRLDPGQTGYALQVAALHEARGDQAAASRMQADLEQNFQAYYGMFGRVPEPEKPKPAKVLPDSKPEPAAAPVLRPAVTPWSPPNTFSTQGDLQRKPALR